METGKDLEHVAEDVLPHLEKFLESPEEKRLRRLRAGVITAGVGFGVTLGIFWASLSAGDLVPFIALGVIAILVGLGIIINGLAFSVPRKTVANLSEEAKAQKDLESRIQNAGASRLSSGSPSTNELPTRTDAIVARHSVTEHTTHQLDRNKL